MDLIHWFVDIFLHLDKHLDTIVSTYQSWTYLILFAIIFCETGLVVTPFLPGDSLLFLAGAISAHDHQPIHVGTLLGLLAAAAVLGDTVNYWIGHIVGPKVFHKDNVRLLNKKHLMRAHEFYEKYGGVTIIIARFMPFIRTFAPFVAGIGSMTYWRFLTYNVVGGAAWIAAFTLLGYFVGDAKVPIGGHVYRVQDHFSVITIAIVIISLMPMVIEYLRHRETKK